MKTTERMMEVLNGYSPTGRDFKVIKTMGNSVYRIETFWCGVILTSVYSPNSILGIMRKQNEVCWFLPYIPSSSITIKELKHMCLGPVYSHDLALEYLDKFHSMTYDFVVYFRTPIEV